MFFQYLCHVFTIVVPVVVTGMPQMGIYWIGQESDTRQNDDVAPLKPQFVSTSQGQQGLELIPEKSTVGGYVNIQVFLNNPQSTGELVKIHDSNSSFTIPKELLSFRETESKESNKKCGENQLLYEANGRCYHTGRTAPGEETPCADDFMKFSAITGREESQLGECQCVPFRGNTARPVVRWEKSNRCYWLFDQGPCETGQWLVYENSTGASLHNNSKSVICAPRKCNENTQENESATHPKIWVEIRGKCYQTESPSKELCGDEKKKVYFKLDATEPVCADDRPELLTTKGLVSGAGSLRCKAGQKQLPNGECRRVALFD